MIEKKFLDECLAIVGKQGELLQFLEEISELQKEVLKNINRKKDNLDCIAEEVADVEIMMAQLKNIYQIEEQVERKIIEKIERTKGKFGIK